MRRWKDVQVGDMMLVTGAVPSRWRGMTYVVLTKKEKEEESSAAVELSVLLSDGGTVTWTGEPDRIYPFDELLARR